MAHKESDDVTISDHAVLRYLERVVGFDITQIKSEILTAEAAMAIKQLGDGKYPVDLNGNQYRAIVHDNVVVTITLFND